MTIHGSYANSGDQAVHSLKFARMGLAYAVELGTDGPASEASYDCKFGGASSSESRSVKLTAHGDVCVQLLGYKAGSYRLDVS